MTTYFRCRFCQEYCNKGWRQDNGGDLRYYLCNNCNVEFIYYKNKVNTIEFHCNIKFNGIVMRRYTLHILYSINKTILYQELEKIIEINNISLNISPINIEDKIKTILTFL